MTVQENIRAGKYENKVPYSVEKEPVDEDVMTVRQAREHTEAQQQRQRDQHTAHRVEENRLTELLRADLEAEHLTPNHPKAKALWDKAWERGHSSGYESVMWEYIELAELVR